MRIHTQSQGTSNGQPDTTNPPMAMGFYHDKGMVPSYRDAKRFSGKAKRLATLPDIVEARLNSELGTTPWETWFTTISAEFMGVSRQGTRVLVIAHANHPLSSLDGLLKAYGYEFKDQSRRNNGGRISQAELWKLMSGEVEIIDLNSYQSRNRGYFGGHQRASELFDDPVFRARCGARCEEYLRQFAEAARKWHAEHAGQPAQGQYEARMREVHRNMAKPNSDPFLVHVGMAPNCTYPLAKHEFDSSQVFAHLLSCGALANIHHSDWDRNQYVSLAHSFDCHEWWNGTKMVGVNHAGLVTTIHPGPGTLTEQVHQKWQQLLVPTDRTATDSNFFPLMKVGEEFFTQYPKKGERMDTHEPHYRVVKIEKVEGGSQIFRTTSCGGMFFRFGINEVKQIAPRRANAYLMGEAKREGSEYHIAPIEFFHVEVDATQRMLTTKEVRRDFNLMMSILDS